MGHSPLTTIDPDHTKWLDLESNNTTQSYKKKQRQKAQITLKVGVKDRR